MPHTARPFVLHEATLPQIQKLAPNVAVLPWGATEAHNKHLPHGTDVTEVTAIAEGAVQRANEQGARCLLLPTIPFGNDNMQVSQVATITMRSSTQQLVLFDVADSLVRQGIDRLVVINGHGANEFRSMIRDVMLDLPIFIVQVMSYAMSPEIGQIIKHRGEHADEYETSLMLHLAPQWVRPLDEAGDGQTTPSKLPAITDSPGVWAPRDWAAFTQDTGVGNPKEATAEKGRLVLEKIVNAIVPVLTQLSAAMNGEFPYVIRRAQP